MAIVGSVRAGLDLFSSGGCLSAAVTASGLPWFYVCFKGSHAVYRSSDGRVVVIPEHGTIKRGTLGSVLRQAGLTPAGFLKLLD